MSGMKVANDVRAHPTKDRGISSALMMRAYLRVPELTTPARTWNTKGRKWATILEPHKLSQTVSANVSQEQTISIDQPNKLTDFYPGEEPDDGHLANLCFGSSCGADNDGDSDTESQRRDIDKVTCDDAEIEDFGVDSAHAVERVFFAIIADFLLSSGPAASQSARGLA